MKAVVYRDYGGRDVLGIEDVPDPGAPATGELRVRVHASSINPVDAKVRRGELKLIAGGRFPKRPGLDFSGVVEAVGPGVIGISVGDAVFGGARSMSEGAMAEHVLVKAAAVAAKPGQLDHAQAAAVPTVAIAALQVLRDIVHVSDRDHVIVNGCTGGVGLFAMQMAKRAGARVTGVCGADGVATARAFGADEVIDYRNSILTGITPPASAILELSGRLDFGAAVPLLADGGRYIDFSPSPAAIIANAIANPFRRKKHVLAMTAARTADLSRIAADIDAGILVAAPTRIFPLDRFAEAFELAERGGVIGKIVLQIAPGR